MMLLSIHVGAIALLIAVVAPIAYHVGKKEGIRITGNYYEEQRGESITNRPSESETGLVV
ncbi:MAG: hypothetical protein HQM14_00160 [SAR324 cluster bacterium]|nr:hypothetical protein [SAR324 cluster bacterium]